MQDTNCCLCRIIVDAIAFVLVAWLAIAFWPLLVLAAAAWLAQALGRGLWRSLVADWRAAVWPSWQRIAGLGLGVVAVLGVVILVVRL